MSHKASVEALDRTTRDLRNSYCPMGGCTFLFSRDEVNASLKRSYLWPHLTKCELKTNMRTVSSSQDNRQFSIDLLLIDNGVNGFITLNNLCVLVKNVEELTENIYPDISNISTKTINWFQERVHYHH